MIDQREAFELLYDRTDFSDIAEVLNAYFELEIDPEIDDRKFHFSSTRYGEHLLIVPTERFDQSDFIRLPISWTDDWRVFVDQAFDSILEDYLEDTKEPNVHDFTEHFIKEWGNHIIPRIENHTPFTVKERTQ